MAHRITTKSAGEKFQLLTVGSQFHPCLRLLILGASTLYIAYALPYASIWAGANTPR